MAISFKSSPRQIECLEQINALIDLYVDNGCYEEVKEIMPNSVISGFDTDEGPKSKNDPKRIIENLRSGPRPGEKIDSFLSGFSLGISDYPIREIFVPKEFQSKFRCSRIRLNADESFKPWSHLFWAKLVRTELLRQNRNPWLKLYDHVIRYLESKIELSFCDECSSKENQFWWKTQFNYLMELSAVSIGEGSIGYAERARPLRNIIAGIQGKITPYDRWIWYNKAVGYQHTQRDREASSHFNELTASFFREHPKLDENKEISIIIEFLLNIAPSFMHTAEIYIKGQLAYHALECLDDIRLVDWLKKVRDNSKSHSLAYISKQIELRIDLLRLEAMLILGDLAFGKNKINELQSAFNGKKRKRAFGYTKIPMYQYNSSKPPSMLEVSFIECKIIWFREEALGLLDKIRNSEKLYAKEEEKRKIKVQIDKLIDRIKTVRDYYWSWVNNNPHDKIVYVSNWAQFLEIGMKITTALIDSNTWPGAWNNVLTSIIDLYDTHYKLLAGLATSDLHIGSDPIKLEALRTDNRIDITDGLNAFYEGMILIRSKIGVKNSFGGKKSPTLAKYYVKLQQDHNRFLNALSEWDKNFGLHQRIDALKRCNQRIRWASVGETGNDCIACNVYDKCFFPLFGKGSRLDCKKENADFLAKDDYEIIMHDAEEHFSKHLKDNSSHVPEEESLHFLGLQRWNSLTPAQGKSVGGGYFIYHTNDRGEVDLGIAIDPGFDFIRNLFRQGFSIRDIDLVLISHAHPDHLWDFESIVQLSHDLSQKAVDHNKHRINVILTWAAYQRYKDYVIDNPELRKFIEPFIINIHNIQSMDTIKGGESFSFVKNPRKENESERQPQRWTPLIENTPIDENRLLADDNVCEVQKLKIIPTEAYHDDYSRISDSYGFIIEFSFKNIFKNLSLGYTGDTKWVGKDFYGDGCPVQGCPGKSKEDTKCYVKCPKNIAVQYRDCEVLLMHLGSLIDHKRNGKFDNYKGSKDCEKLVREKNHLYMMGMIRFLKSLSERAGNPIKKDKLILISEFGEELQGGIRVDIVRRLENKLPWTMLPVDVGLDILLRSKGKLAEEKKKEEHKFICSLCNKPHALENITYERFGYDEAIFYVCRTCMKARPLDVRQDQMRQLYESGKEIKVLPEERDETNLNRISEHRSALG